MDEQDGSPGDIGPQDQLGDTAVASGLSLTSQQLASIMKYIKDHPTDEITKQILKRHPQLMVAIIQKRQQDEMNTSGPGSTDGAADNVSQQQMQLMMSQLEISLKQQVAKQQQQHQHMPLMQNRFMLPQQGPTGRIVRRLGDKVDKTNEESK